MLEKHLRKQGRFGLLLLRRSGRFISPLYFLYFKDLLPQACCAFELVQSLGIRISPDFITDDILFSLMLLWHI